MRYYSSTATVKTLSTAMTTSSTTMQLSDLVNLPTSYPYTMVIDPDGAEEIVLVTSLASGTTVNITRGTDTYQGVAGGNGTSKQAHSAGVSVKHMVTARDLQEPQNHIAASSAVHGLSGSIVGTSDSQTLTNKTINSANNSLTISQNNVTNLTSDLALKAPLASPTFTGTVTLPTGSVGVTPTANDNSTKVATTAYVDTNKVADPAANGLVARTAAGSAAARTIAVSGQGMSITNADGVSGNPTIAYSGPKVLYGSANITFSSSSAASGSAITFSSAFTSTPTVVVSQVGGNNFYYGGATSVSTTGFTPTASFRDSTSQTGTITVNWIAVGV